MTEKVLLVDDDAGLRRLLRTMLEMGGYVVSEAEDGLAALAVMPEVEPDIIILDVMMPNMDGVTFCRTLRQDPRWTELPVMMLSGKTQHWAVEEGLAAGANEYLFKPIAFGALLEKVRGLLGS